MRNTKIAYFLVGLYRSWFWMGIWVLFYLRFTNYTGIGILESLMIISRILTEIPTGAIADLLGKKKTLLIAFLLSIIGNFVMGNAGGFEMLIVSVLLFTTAGSFFSGTLEALVYDSLKEEKKEKLYEKAISNMFTIQLGVFALCSIMGGYLYTISPGLPFFAVGVLHIVALFLTFFIREPRIDSLQFSLRNFIQQNKEGFKELFKHSPARREILYLLSITVFLVMLYEVLNDVLAVEFGFQARDLGVLMAIVYVFGAFGSQLTVRVTKRFNTVGTVTCMSLLVASTLFMSPYVTLLLGGLTIILRSAPHAVLENMGSIVVNKHTASKYRATTLSTFNMLRSIPYAFFAIGIGSIMDSITAKNVAGILGIVVLVTVLLFQIRIPRFMKNITSNN